MIDSKTQIPMNERERRVFGNVAREALGNLQETLPPGVFREWALKLAAEHEEWLRREMPNSEILRQLDNSRG